MTNSIESLEPRRLLAVTLDNNGTLFVIGTYKDDSIHVAVGTHAGELTVAVRLNGQVQLFDPAEVTSVRIHGRRGHDFIVMSDNQDDGFSSVRISGEGGNDAIRVFCPARI